MRAAVCREYGPPEVLRVEDLPAPELAAGQARVRVGAAAVNVPDVLLMANLAAVQLGVVLGATVTAVAFSAEKLAAAARGAARGINHRPGRLREALREALPDGADVVVDPVGGDLAEPALRALRWGGPFVTVGCASGTVPRIPLNLVLLKGNRVLGFELRGFVTRLPDEARRGKRELTDLLASRRALPHIGAAFGLAEAAAALRHVADGRAIGKVVLDAGPHPPAPG